MIYFQIIFSLTVLLMIFVSYREEKKLKQEKQKWHDMYWAENRLHQETLVKFEKADEELKKYMASCRARAEERDAAISELNHAKFRIESLEEALSKPKEKIEETGTFVLQRKLRPATPQTYQVVFDMDINGQRILEHLANQFCRPAFSNTDRETNYKLGQQHVVNYIINQINKANDPDYTEELSND